MIITDKFVFIHWPKTGGTFVKRVMIRIHEARGDRIATHNARDFDDVVVKRVYRSRKPGHVLRGLLRPTSTLIHYRNYAPEVPGFNQHGTCQQIPPEHRQKPILATVRNPYDRYVSRYEFGWWKDRPHLFWADPEAVQARYPAFPEITFAEFLALLSAPEFRVNPQFLPDGRLLGRMSQEFIRYFFRHDHATIVPKLTEEYIASGAYRADQYEVHFLSTDDLNRQLYDYLLKVGYAARELAFILEIGKIMPKRGGRRDDQRWQRYYTPELKALVRDLEWPIFTMFPAYDV